MPFPVFLSMSEKSFHNLSPERESILSSLPCENIHLYLKRDDLLHPVISGNKWRKLLPVIREAMEKQCRGILTFGGAWSNHIHATAFACREAGLLCTGVIRGEKPEIYSDTLLDAEKTGMQLVFVSREIYRQKHTAAYIRLLQEQYPGYLIVPEGGAGKTGAEGCTDIVRELPFTPDYICLPCGTGTTIAGVTKAAEQTTAIIGFSALANGTFLYDDIRGMSGINAEQVQINSNYSCGGYAKVNTVLEDFICDFYACHHILLEPVYTGKMLMGITDMARQGYFPAGATVVAVHTGGLQGLRGYPELLNRLNKIHPTGMMAGHG